MSESHGMDVVYFALLLVLPIAALVARRVPMSKVGLYALAWIAIAAAVVAIVMLFGLGKPAPRREPASGMVSLGRGAATPG